MEFLSEKNNYDFSIIIIFLFLQKIEMHLFSSKYP